MKKTRSALPSDKISKRSKRVPRTKRIPKHMEHMADNLRPAWGVKWVTSPSAVADSSTSATDIKSHIQTLPTSSMGPPPDIPISQGENFSPQNTPGDIPSIYPDNSPSLDSSSHSFILQPNYTLVDDWFNGPMLYQDPNNNTSFENPNFSIYPNLIRDDSTLAPIPSPQIFALETTAGFSMSSTPDVIPEVFNPSVSMATGLGTLQVDNGQMQAFDGINCDWGQSEKLCSGQSLVNWETRQYHNGYPSVSSAPYRLYTDNQGSQSMIQNSVDQFTQDLYKSIDPAVNFPSVTVTAHSNSLTNQNLTYLDQAQVQDVFDRRGVDNNFFPPPPSQSLRTIRAEPHFNRCLSAPSQGFVPLNDIPNRPQSASFPSHVSSFNFWESHNETQPNNSMSYYSTRVNPQMVASAHPQDPSDINNNYMINSAVTEDPSIAPSSSLPFS